MQRAINNAIEDAIESVTSKELGKKKGGSKEEKGGPEGSKKKASDLEAEIQKAAAQREKERKLEERFQSENKKQARLMMLDRVSQLKKDIIASGGLPKRSVLTDSKRVGGDEPAIGEHDALVEAGGGGLVGNNATYHNIFEKMQELYPIELGGKDENYMREWLTDELSRPGRLQSESEMLAKRAAQEKRQATREAKKGGELKLEPGEKRPSVREELSGGAPAATEAKKLPRDLGMATPRYNMGSDAYQPQFESDIDKALFITSQKKKSKSDARYRSWLKETAGMTDEEIEQGGKNIRDTIKELAKQSAPGDIDNPSDLKIPETWTR